MAKKFLTPLGLVGLTSDPASGSEGQLYFNTTDDVVRVYANGAWTELSGSGGGASVYYQAEAPDGAELGALWVDSDSTGTGGSSGGGSTGTSLLFWTEDSDGNLIPDIDNIYSIGSSAYRVKDLYLGASSLYLQNPASASANISLSVDSSGNLKINDSKIITESNANNNLNLTNYATLQYAQSASAAAVSYLVDSAPGALDTLNELANALGDDQNFATTVTNALSSKLSIVSASSTYATQQDLANIDLSNYITASAASATYQKLIPFGSASPVPINSGEMWVDTTAGARTLRIWDGTGWFEEGYVPTPTVTSISPNSYNGLTGTIFEVFGTNFQTGATVSFIGSNGAANSAAIVTRNSSTKLTVASINLSIANEPYSIRVTNPSGNFGLLGNALDAGSTPTWNTSAGNLGTMYDIERSIKTYTVSATDPDGTSLVYSVSSGSLPSGMTLNSSTGVISGTATAVVSDTTYTFTIQATDGVNTSSREFNIILKAPVTITYYTNSTFTAPTQLTGVSLLAVGGGGGAGNNRGNGSGGNGGGGGIVFYNFKAVTAGQSYNVVIGGGGSGAGCNNQSGCQGGSTTGIGVTAGAGGGGVSEYNGNCSGGTSSIGVSADIIYDGGTGGCSFGAAGGGFQYTNTSFGSPTIFGGQCSSSYYGGGGCASGGGGAAGIFRIKY